MRRVLIFMWPPVVSELLGGTSQKVSLFFLKSRRIEARRITGESGERYAANSGVSNYSSFCLKIRFDA